MSKCIVINKISEKNILNDRWLHSKCESCSYIYLWLKFALSIPAIGAEVMLRIDFFHSYQQRSSCSCVHLYCSQKTSFVVLEIVEDFLAYPTPIIFSIFQLDSKMQFQPRIQTVSFIHKILHCTERIYWLGPMLFLKILSLAHPSKLIAGTG